MDFRLFWHKTLRRPYRLHTASYGSSDKPAVVLLHGIAASSEDWQKLIPLLTPHYHCITIDLLGFAQSPKPQWSRYTMDDHIRSVRHTVGRLDLQGPFVLAGHSLGALLATQYARRYPRDINRLLLLSPPVYPARASITKKSALHRTDLLLRVYKFLRTHPRATRENMRRLSRILPLPRSIITYPDTWLPFMRSLEQCVEQQTIRHDLSAINLPVDIFYGSLDSVVVGDNVRLLAGAENVRLYSFRGNHSIGRNYAKVVAAVLKP